MLVKIFIKYIMGYVRIVVEGYYIERFINICTNNNILIWNLKREKSVRLHLNLGINDFKKIFQIARKTKCRVKIESKHGVPFLLHRYKKRKIFFIFLILVLLCILISSNYVWHIEIKEENNEELTNITEDLEKAGLKPGMAKSKVNTKEVINNVRLNRDDVSWMGIELNGTNAIVKISKAKEAPEIVDENEYCNIVANESGLITKVNAQNGTAQVKEGDVVQKGDILIAGIMEGKHTDSRYVHATGEIQAKVWYTKSKTIEYNQEILNKTGNEEKNFGIKINNFKINFPKKLPKFELYDTIEEEKNLKLFPNFYIPISIIKTTYQEETKEIKTYNYDEAVNTGKQELEQELGKQITNKENILRRNCKHTRKRKWHRGICNI